MKQIKENKYFYKYIFKYIDFFLLVLFYCFQRIEIDLEFLLLEAFHRITTVLCVTQNPDHFRVKCRSVQHFVKFSVKLCKMSCKLETKQHVTWGKPEIVIYVSAWLLRQTKTMKHVAGSGTLQSNTPTQQRPSSVGPLCNIFELPGPLKICFSLKSIS